MFKSFLAGRKFGRDLRTVLMVSWSVFLKEIPHQFSMEFNDLI